MKIKCLLCASLILSSLLFTTLFANTKETTLPIIRFQDNIPIVNIKINGHTIPARIDTGGAAVGLTLSYWDAKTINPHYTGGESCYYVGSHMIEICRKTIMAPKLNLGKFTLNHVIGNVARRDIGYYAGLPPKNYIFSNIGLDVLNHFNLLLDYPHNKIVLTKNDRPPSKYAITKWTKIPIQYEQGNELIASTKMNGTNAELIWDTGASCSWIKSATGVKAKKFRIKNKGDCGRYVIKPSRFTVDGIKIPRSIFHLRWAKSSWDGIIGADYFKEHIVFIDFKNHNIYIKE